MNDPWCDLTVLGGHLWARLERGARHAEDPFRFVALATSGALGPEVRTVGLRRVDAVAREVEVHSDVRTAKVAAVRLDPRAQLMLWDSVTQVQLRLSVRMVLISADEARWSRVPSAARLNYGTDPAPGLPLESPEALTRTPDGRWVAP